MNPENQENFANDSEILLNPNCSEVVWRIKGSSEKYKGTNQLPASFFITEILDVFQEKSMAKDRILAAVPIYVKGDGGPDILEWSFKFAQDIVAGIRDPREIDHPDFEDIFFEHGYDAGVAHHWEPLVTGPRNPGEPLLDAEKHLASINQPKNSRMLAASGGMKRNGAKKRNTNAVVLDAGMKKRLHVVVNGFINTSPKLAPLVHRIGIRGGRVYLYCIGKTWNPGTDDPDPGLEGRTNSGERIENTFARVTVRDEAFTDCTIDWQRPSGQWVSLSSGTLEECLKFAQDDETYFDKEAFA
jgi:hypothetical protein